jgi:hypothetical protein
MTTASAGNCSLLSRVFCGHRILLSYAGRSVAKMWAWQDRKRRVSRPCLTCVRCRLAVVGRRRRFQPRSGARDPEASGQAWHDSVGGIEAARRQEKPDPQLAAAGSGVGSGATVKFRPRRSPRTRWRAEPTGSRSSWETASGSCRWDRGRTGSSARATGIGSMIGMPLETQVWLASGPTDMRQIGYDADDITKVIERWRWRWPRLSHPRAHRRQVRIRHRSVK